ncbi:zinc ABC transporter substrate-binding protein [Thiotrichales bacterium 19X7-9]|nr:zinc ABC transporter substrate-binding protein [Thiotrichales bacterium 19X7-9]
MKIYKILFIIFISSFMPLYANIQVIAAENFYGQVAKSIGGKYVDVTSIISNPDSDPHLFTTSPKTMMAFSKAQVIIYNGLDYDPWINQMLQSQQSKNTIETINVGELMGIKSGSNPHIWYNPYTFPTLAKKLTKIYAKIEPENKDYFKENLISFMKNYHVVFKTIHQLKIKTNKLPVTATEPVFGYMADALGMNMKGKDVQWQIMNDTTPSPKMMAQYEDLLTHREVKLLFYNNQVKEPATETIKALAEKNHIAIIGVSETMPPNDTVSQWLQTTLNQISAKVKQ